MWNFLYNGKVLDRQQRRGKSKEALDEMYEGTCRIFKHFTIDRKIIKKISMNIPEVGIVDKNKAFVSESEFAMFCLKMKRRGIEIR